MRATAMAPLLPLAALLAPAGAGTYANPVLVDTHEIRRASPAPSVGTLPARSEGTKRLTHAFLRLVAHADGELIDAVTVTVRSPLIADSTACDSIML